MEIEEAVEETEEEVVVDEAEPEGRCPPAAQKIVGWIVGAILIFLAQRDLRKRPPELVRGRVGLWKAAAMLPPGAVAYLVFGRRRAAPPVTLEMPNSIAA